MTYPNTPGYQAHSETSREAAERLSPETLVCAVLSRVQLGGKYGRTADDLSIIFDVPQSTIAARLRELELAGRVIKTTMKRETRHKRNAFVYVHPEHFTEDMGRAAVKSEPPADIIRLQAEHTRMKEALERIEGHCMNGNRCHIREIAQAALGRV